MAELIKTFIPFSSLGAALTLNAASGSDYFTTDNADQRLTLVIQNGNTQDATVTFGAGDGALSALGDVPVAVAGSTSVAVPFSRISSARVKVESGADKGRVLVTTAVETGGSIASVLIGIISAQ
jgi:hypothetical protein